ncbi:cyclase family protein [Catenulispora yoronensis]|uniref:Cyclase family protein n=1 Tax=Catenulispora yoronensis TaxID=450799 RepID=A0ABN2V8E1_9ACTN
MRIIDLSTAVDATLWEPEPVQHVPMSPRQGAEHMTSAMREHFGLDLSPDELPDGEFLNNDTFTLTAHTGTHVDAPAHYGTNTAYGTPRTIDQLPLDWFFRPGFVLDLTGLDAPVARRADLEKALVEIEYEPRPYDIAMLNTGSWVRAGTPEYFTDFVGLDGPATDFLLDLGVKVIGTDGFSLDAPFSHIIAEYRATGDRSLLWPAHFAGRRREYCQIERLANLGALPRPHGFTVSCLPVKLTGAGAGWTRAVAIFDNEYVDVYENTDDPGPERGGPAQEATA